MGHCRRRSLIQQAVPMDWIISKTCNTPTQWDSYGHLHVRSVRDIMTRVKPGCRKRVRAPKARTGCLTCKYVLTSVRKETLPGMKLANFPNRSTIFRLCHALPFVRLPAYWCVVRKLKCDEAKPVCAKCQLLLYKRNYTSEPNFGTSGISTGRACSYHPSLAGSIIAGPSLSLSQSSQELRSLQFYVESTLGLITTFFPDELWSSIVLQLAHCETSIRHALFALASYHELFLHTGRHELHEDSFALYQYNRAIEEILRSPKSPSSIHTSLISSIFLFCIEVCWCLPVMFLHIHVISDKSGTRHFEES